MVVVAGLLWAGLSVGMRVGGSDEENAILRNESPSSDVWNLNQRFGLAQVDADVTRLLRMSSDRRDIRAAGGSLVAETEDPEPRVVTGGDVDLGTGLLIGQGHGTPEEALDVNPYLEEATAYYGVEWARDALIIVRFRESTNILVPCVVGERFEAGPFQFMAGTWAGTPYAHLDPCDLEAATWAAAWKVAQPEGWRAWWSTWPR